MVGHARVVSRARTAAFFDSFAPPGRAILPVTTQTGRKR